MTLQKRIAVLVTAVIIVVAAALWAHAQSRPIPPPIQPVTPTVLSNGDVGFRVLGMRGGTPVGELVVRINGEWLTTGAAGFDPHFQMR